MNANQQFVPPPGSGSIDFYAMAKESGFLFDELVEVAEILQTRLHRPAEVQEILLELRGRYSPRPQQFGGDLHEFYIET